MSVFHKVGLFATLVSFSSVALAEARVIYGDDNRMDWFDSHNDPKLVNLARSTAILVKKADMSHDLVGGRIKLPTESFGKTQNLCADEPFFEQPNPGFCSGFLVGPDLFVTAGHCITDQAMCSGVGMIFDYAYDHQGKDLSTVDPSDVYYCKSIVGRMQESGLGKDFAVVKLDRAVVGREPLKLRRNGAISVNSGVTVIGHPSGLPSKIASGAIVRTNEAAKPYFVANLDTYGGNSGSAVFNTLTGDVEGILVRGETDFITRGSCMVSNRCAAGSCRGEDVTKASVFVNLVPEL